DATIGANTVLMPFGGKYQLTPIQAMVHKIAVEKKHTDDCSYMSWGYNPYITEKSMYHGAYLAVVESVAKLVATGAEFKDVYLSFQEYFEKLGKDGKRWGKPMAALLGAFKAQKGLGVAAIGGKDSMSGSFENINVPPTLVSFAVTTGKVNEVISNEFKGQHRVVLLKPEYDEAGLPTCESLLALFAKVTGLMREGKVLAAYTPTMGGVAEAVAKMCFGNGFGFNFDKSMTMEDLFGYSYGSFVLEVTDEVEGAKVVGDVTKEAAFTYLDQKVCYEEALSIYEDRLESVYPCNIEQDEKNIPVVCYNAKERKAPAVITSTPKVLIPVFPGNNCEYDSRKAMLDAGADAEIFVINNLTSAGISRSVEEFAKKLKDSQMVFIPGGFSGGDEPDGSGKFITAFFRNAEIKEAVTDLLENRDGLMCGICNGFQALVKLGLVPFGKIIDTDANCPTLTFNTIARHQSKIVRTRIASNMSPWLSQMNVGDIVSVPISHGEGRFIANDDVLNEMIKNGQIATQYVDLEGNLTTDVRFNPNDSVFAIEGITSPDGRVFGKMGHSERTASGLYKNVPGDFDIKMFESAVKYFKG
ncbi:MAG: phosphoribosylformylglycinamidine synthase subunit PurQ, partial [Clostridia bacterium]|nr:phosphoribosylformylglycinamidine synthase subunit PurQ [Clostridia bacterium]